MASQDPRPCAVHLVPLGLAHVPAILAGQDPLLAREVVGRAWDGASLQAFAARAQRWSPDGPLRELVALDAAGDVLGGGGVHRLGAGLERGEVDLSYWVLAAHRGRGLGHAVARALVDLARADPRHHRAVLRIAPENRASATVARALGAERAGMRERHPADASREVERWVLPLR